MAKIRPEDEIIDDLITQVGAEMAKIKTADERIERAKVAMERVQEAYVDLAVEMEKLRLIIIEIQESPVIIELAKEHAQEEEEYDPLGLLSIEEYDRQKQEHERLRGQEE